MWNAEKSHELEVVPAGHVYHLSRDTPDCTFLPLGFLASQELIQYLDILLQPLQPLVQLFLYPLLVIAQLDVKVLSVRRRAHGGGEERLDDKGVVRLERVAVCSTEGSREFFGRVGQVLAECLSGEVEATSQPHESLGSDVLLRLELVTDEVLKVLRV